MKGLDARQDRGRRRSGVTENRRQGDGCLGDRPGVGQVAEVDDAVRLPERTATGGGGDDVGVGEIEMYRLAG